MNIKYLENIGIFILENVFSEEEQKNIWQELKNYMDNKIMLPPEETGAALNDQGFSKKKNSAVFLDTLYTREGRNISYIFKYTQKHLLSLELQNYLKEKNEMFEMLRLANSHYTLLNYYEDSDYYDYHHDNAAFSTLSYFFKEPKIFEGGNVIFKKNNKFEEVEVKNNMSIFFPSFYQHKVVPIKMKKEFRGKNLGRFSVAQFIGINI